jgi:hypothetical protein
MSLPNNELLRRDHGTTATVCVGSLVVDIAYHGSNRIGCARRDEP